MKITAAATGCPVSNFDESIRFFIDTLGFSQEFKHEGTAALKRENCLIHLWQAGDSNRTAGSASAYLFCDQVDSAYQDLISKGVVTASEPKEYPFGMREFELTDLGGNRFTFGATT